jgi:hypothetical protein
MNLRLKNENFTYSSLTLSLECTQYSSIFYSYFQMMADYWYTDSIVLCVELELTEEKNDNSRSKNKRKRIFPNKIIIHIWEGTEKYILLLIIRKHNNNINT